MAQPLVIKVPTKRTSYVAVDSNTNEVIAHGGKMKTVMDKAKKTKNQNYGIMFVPKQGQRYIF